ncbi:MAG: thioredoxin-dependent thiol peroxidase [Candidatus Hydrogenedentes bacterium]|nr:thioredoxin-dependent thiol peroxidase [Candidatus Hydrogenedentota bacterium]
MANAKENHPLTGKKAPAFTLSSGEETSVKLSEFKGKNVVLYFYPKDNTPGCTREAKEFSDLQAEFEALNTVVLGVSPDSITSHCKFTEKHELTVMLLSDPDHKIAEKYGAWGEKTMCGRTYMGIIRSTFFIDSKGTVRQAWTSVKAAGHAAAVLKQVREFTAA